MTTLSRVYGRAAIDSSPKTNSWQADASSFMLQHTYAKGPGRTRAPLKTNTQFQVFALLVIPRHPLGSQRTAFYVAQPQVYLIGIHS